MNEDVCRICRGEETPEEPLYHPCRCSGSIKYVHQDCLLEWLQHARVRTSCDVCGTDYVLHKRYKPSMTSELPLKDYAIFALRSLRDYNYIIFYTVRGVFMVCSLALVSKYVLEYGVLLTENTVFGSNDPNGNWFRLWKRMSQKPPRKSVLPVLDTIVSFIIPESEFRSALINGILLILGFICGALFCWFIAMWVLNEQALLHDLEHIELGEMSHMDQGDDEDLLAELHPPNGRINEEMHGRLHESSSDQQQQPEQPPQETVVEFTPKSDLFEDLRPEHVVRMEDDALNGIPEDDADAEDFGVFLARVLGELFGAPNGVMIRGFLSAVVFFSTLAASYPTIYWQALVLKQAIGSLLLLLAKRAKLPSLPTEMLRSVFIGTPQSVTGHVVLVGAVQILVVTTIRLSILYNMQSLLKRRWGRNFVIVAYQVYAVLKTLLMTLIETVIFPQFCGTLMHVAVIPITPSWTWHWQKYKEYPYWTLSLQWIAGYAYMHGFQIFVSACRKFFRKGVLFFLHDNDAVYFMRSIMLLSLPKQLRRIGISACIYGSFIVFGIGSTCVMLRVLEPSAWPLELLYWPGAQCLRLWPFIIIFSSFVVPLNRSGKQLKSVLSLWLKERVWLRMFSFIAQKLDLESFLFATPRELSEEESAKLGKGDKSSGYFVRAPVDFPLRPRKALNLFVPVNAHNERLDGKIGVQQNELSKYTIVWRPPYFTVRIALLALMSWTFITFLTLMFTLVPMQLGRLLDTLVFNKQIRNDLILTLAGLSVCLPVYAQALKRMPPRELELCVRFMSIFGILPQPKRSDSLSSAFWAGAFTILCFNSQTPWSHWLVFHSRQDSLPSIALSAILNFAAFFTGNMYSACWTNAIATADFLVWQVILELTGTLPRSTYAVLAGSMVLASYRLWQIWYVSRPAKVLSDSVREALYLDATEVRNYEPDANTSSS